MTVPTAPYATVAHALAGASTLGVARLDAQLLLLRALGRPVVERAWLLAHDDAALSEPASSAFSEMIRRRRNGEPVAYLLGEKEFRGLTLQVDARVLVPRPDTETLVDWAQECLAGLAESFGGASGAGAAVEADAKVIDLGTGSGAIALALKHAMPTVQVYAVDASVGALEVASANARRLGLEVIFRQADWLAGAEQSFSLIVSNPPYVAQDDPHLPALRHEPISALAAGPDGLDDIRRIVQDAPSHLAPGGWLLLEHGHDQAETVRALLMARGFEAVQSRTDLAGIQRCSGGSWPAVK